MSEQTTAPPPSLAEQIDGGRARIDELDGQIIELVRTRIAVSRSVQEARVGAGGTRVQHAREIDIVGRYRTALGERGPALALLILELARG